MEKRNIHLHTDLKTRAIENENVAIIEGYFIRYNSETELFDNHFEEVAPNAFDKSLKNRNVLCLDNHDSRAILGSTGSGTLKLNSDENGLYGEVTLDLEDPNAKSAYRKVRTGKVTGCSFGFGVIQEDFERQEDKYKWIIKEAELYEVSITGFPAYPQTDISARKSDVKKMKREKFEARKKQLKERLTNA